MAPDAHDDWNRIDNEDDELQDSDYFDSQKDVILFCIDCSESMQEFYDDPLVEDNRTCHLLSALDAAVQIQKRKAINSPNDLTGILLFNTERQARGKPAETKANNFLYQPISSIDVTVIQKTLRLLDATREDPGKLLAEFPPLKGKKTPLGDVFTSCNWVLRNGAAKKAAKRIFLISDDDDPLSGSKNQQLISSAINTAKDLIQTGVSIEPFFISSESRPFDLSKFYSDVLKSSNSLNDEIPGAGYVLPESLSITRIDEIIDQMRFRESPKRTLFNTTLQLAKDFVIGIKGYNLLTEQRKGVCKYFVDLGDRMQSAQVKTSYTDEERQADTDKSKMLFGMSLGDIGQAATNRADDEGGDSGTISYNTRSVGGSQRPFYTADEVRSFREMGLEPGLKLLGFKDMSELRFEDNVKHSTFIYPNEDAYSGSRRTFTALMKSLISKQKFALVLALIRRNTSPVFAALVPSAQNTEEGDEEGPKGLYFIPLPYADDLREVPIRESHQASDELVEAAAAWIGKLSVKKGAYRPDAYPNPALAYHNEQLEASAFREEYDPQLFRDETLPNYDRIHERAGDLIKQWKAVLLEDASYHVPTQVQTVAGSKRKADVSVDEAEIRSKWEEGQLNKLRVDQLKGFLRSKGQKTEGRKAELVDSVTDWFDRHP